MTISRIINHFDSKVWRVSGCVKEYVNRVISYTPEQVAQLMINQEAMDNLDFTREDLRAQPRIIGRTLIFPMSGIFIPDADAFDKMMGFISTLELMDSFKEQIEENIDKIERVILYIDSLTGS